MMQSYSFGPSGPQNPRTTPSGRNVSKGEESEKESKKENKRQTFRKPADPRINLEAKSKAGGQKGWIWI